MAKSVFVTSGSENHTNIIPQEISLLDVLRFIKNAWKMIAIAALAGIVLSIAYLAVVPRQYEASVQIVMAQFPVANSATNPLGVSVEDPALLITRMSQPTSISPQTIAACGLKNGNDAAISLTKSMKITPIKGLPNVVDLKVIGSSKEIVLGCTNAIFELIKATQAKLLTPFIDEAKTKLVDAEARLDKAKDLVAKSDKSGTAMSAAYLSTRDEIRYLLDEIKGLKDMVANNQARMTHLVTPIYASDLPIFPKSGMVMARGFFGGLFLGLVIALVRQMIARLKHLAGGVL